MLKIFIDDDAEWVWSFSTFCFVYWGDVRIAWQNFVCDASETKEEIKRWEKNCLLIWSWTGFWNRLWLFFVDLFFVLLEFCFVSFNSIQLLEGFKIIFQLKSILYHRKKINASNSYWTLDQHSNFEPNTKVFFLSLPIITIPQNSQTISLSSIIDTFFLLQPKSSNYAKQQKSSSSSRSVFFSQDTHVKSAVPRWFCLFFLEIQIDFFCVVVHMCFGT